MIHTDGRPTIANYRATPVVDFKIRDEGSLILLQPLNVAAKAWVEENLDEDVQTFGGNYVIERGYFVDIFDAIVDSGLTVR